MPLDAPRRRAGRPRPSAPEPGVAEDVQAGAHLLHRRRAPASHGLRTREKRDGLPRRSSAGAARTSSEQHDGSDGRDHQRLLVALEEPDGGEHDRAEHAPAPTRLRRVWETSVPSTIGQRLAHAAEPARHDQRARGLAETGRQRGGHQHADNVPRARRRGGARACSGSAARRIACQDSARSDHRGAHQAEGQQHPGRAWRPSAAWLIESMPIRWSASQPSPRPRRLAATAATCAHSARRAGAPAPRLGAGSSAGQPLRARLGAAGDRRAAAPWHGARGRRRRGAAGTRSRPRRRSITSPATLRPGEALGALARGGGHARRGARARARARAAPRRARPASAAGHEHAVHAVADHVAVARRCRRPRPACPAANASVSTMPKLSPPSDGAQSTSASRRSRRFSSSQTWPEDLDAAPRRAGSGSTSSRAAPTIVSEAPGRAPRSASKARSSTGRPLRSSARPTNSDACSSLAVADWARGTAAARSTPLGTIR